MSKHHPPIEVRRDPATGRLISAEEWDKSHPQPPITPEQAEKNFLAILKAYAPERYEKEIKKREDLDFGEHQVHGGADGRMSGLLRFIKRIDLLIAAGIALLLAQRLFHWSNNFTFEMLTCVFILKQLVSFSIFFIRRRRRAT